MGATVTVQAAGDGAARVTALRARHRRLQGQGPRQALSRTCLIIPYFCVRMLE